MDARDDVPRVSDAHEDHSYVVERPKLEGGTRGMQQQAPQRPRQQGRQMWPQWLGDQHLGPPCALAKCSMGSKWQRYGRRQGVLPE